MRQRLPAVPPICIYNMKGNDKHQPPMPYPDTHSPLTEKDTTDQLEARNMKEEQTFTTDFLPTTATSDETEDSPSTDIPEDLTEWKKMRSGMMYDWTDPVIDRSLKRSRLACERFNCSGIDHDDYREALENMIPGVLQSVTILPPFHCDHGNGLHLGEGVFVNYNAMFLDAADITIGSHTLIGPNCSLYTPQHPIDYLQRRQTIESAHPIKIGADCWLGGNVTVCPGVTIGDRTVIGAGSVVTHDIPSDCMAAGNPCKVIRKLR